MDERDGGPNEGRWVRRVPATPEDALGQPPGGKAGVEGHFAFAFGRVGRRAPDAERPRNAQDLQRGDEGEPEAEGRAGGGRAERRTGGRGSAGGGDGARPHGGLRVAGEPLRRPAPLGRLLGIPPGRRRVGAPGPDQ